MTQPPGDPGVDDDAAETVGSVGEEAARLIEALGGWARDQAPADPADQAANEDPAEHQDREGGDARPGAAGAAGAAAGATFSAWARALADVGDQVGDHVATGDAECRYCPVCRVIHVVRDTSPEVRAHLAVAASSLAQALAGLLATQVPSQDRPAGPVERIDLDDDSSWDDDPEWSQEGPVEDR